MVGKLQENSLAIDLATDAVRVLDVRFRRGVPQVQAFASQTVSAGTGESLPDRQLSALASLLSTHRLKTRRCVAAMPTTLVVTRSVSIDNTKNQPDEEQVLRTLQNCLPFDSKDLIFDFWAVGAPAPGARTREALVVATQASVVQRYLSGLEKLKLTCTHLDVAPCALASLIAGTSGKSGLIGTVTLSEGGGYFAIIEKEKVLFWRPFELPTGQKAVSAIQAGQDRVGEEISKCVSHMVGSMHVDTLSEFLVFGHGAEDQGFSDYLKNRFHLPVSSPSPFESLSAESISTEVRNAVSSSAATHFAAAIGLAMQTAGGHAHG